MIVESTSYMSRLSWDRIIIRYISLCQLLLYVGPKMSQPWGQEWPLPVWWIVGTKTKISRVSIH